MRHIISALVENKSGVLARIAGLFSARGFNIDSLAVGETEDPTISRMTIVVKGDDRILEQVRKQLGKLVDVISVRDLTKREFIDRELLLFNVNVNQKTKRKVVSYIERNHGKILHTKKDKLTVEFVGDKEHIDRLMQELKEYGISELVRTGRIAMEK